MKDGISSCSGSEAEDKISCEGVYSTSSVNLSKYCVNKGSSQNKI